MIFYDQVNINFSCIINNLEIKPHTLGLGTRPESTIQCSHGKCVYSKNCVACIASQSTKYKEWKK